MNRIDLAKIALRSAEDYLALVKAGRVARLDGWMASYGARKYAAAIASGDIAHETHIRMRRGTCRACPSMWVGIAKEDTEESSWCGRPEPGGMNAALPTCGCFIAGKTAVASEECPQGKWKAVKRVELTVGGGKPVGGSGARRGARA